MVEPITQVNCHNCKFKRNIAGDSHIQCVHKEAFVFIKNIISLNKPLSFPLNIDINEIGIEKGYVIWPINFDPIWLKNCDGFDEQKL